MYLCFELWFDDGFWFCFVFDCISACFILCLAGVVALVVCMWVEWFLFGCWLFGCLFCFGLFGFRWFVGFLLLVGLFDLVCVILWVCIMVVCLRWV